MEKNTGLPDDVVLRVEHVSKKFCASLKRSMLYGVEDIAAGFLGVEPRAALRKGEFWALDDVGFDLHRGESLGIIGSNGSGKSTLLRIITGIYPPDAGRVSFRGQIGALIAVGAGFHPNMTGLENIYLNGTILGMTRAEIDAKLDDIVEFADIGAFLDAPVGTYSSGMRVRLGFSIAVHCEPDILLVDEVLSVGDLAFRNKSMHKMAEYREKANALIFISHNLEQVRLLCQKCMVLEKGRVLYYGDTHGALVYYQELSRSSRIKSTLGISNERKMNLLGYEGGDDSVIVDDVLLVNGAGISVLELDMADPIIIKCIITVKKDVDELFFSFSVLDEKYGNCIHVVSNDNDISRFKNILPGKYILEICIEEHHLSPNVYIPMLAVRNAMTGETYERVLVDKVFKVKSDGKVLERGIVNVHPQWNLHAMIEEVRA